MKAQVAKASLPVEGTTVSASSGNKFTRVHLDMTNDGISLAMVGAASAFNDPRSRHMVTLTPTENGVTLAMVGAASAAVQ